MPRQIAGPKPGTLIDFVPTFGGNGAAPEADRAHVMVRAPSQSEKREHLVEVLEDVTYEADEDGNPVARPGEKRTVGIRMAAVQRRREKAILRWVAGVEGYLAAGGAPILTAAELWESGEPALVDEVFVFIEGLLSLSAAEAKNSAGSSISSPPTTPASDGTAASAEHASSVASGIATEPAPTPSFATLS